MRSNKRLLFVANDPGSLVSHRLPIVLGAKEAGYDVHVACPDGPACDVIRGHEIALHILPVRRGGTNPLSELIGLVALCILVWRLRPGLLHAITLKPVIYGGLAARFCRVPVMVSAIAGLGSTFIGTSFKPRVLQMIIHGLLRSSLAHPNLTVIVQNPDDEAEIIKLAGIPGTAITQIRGSGISLARYPVRNEPLAPVKVVMASRLLLDKGLREFVEAAALVRAQLPGTQFAVAGDLDNENATSVPPDLLEKWRAAGNVAFSGHVTDIAKFYADAHIVVLPSYREGLPRSLIEAAACARAIVTTDAPGCNHAVIPDITGLLVPVRDAEALAVAIMRLCVDDTLRRRMGQAGRAFAEKEFAIETVLARHLEIYAELLKRSGNAF